MQDDQHQHCVEDSQTRNADQCACEEKRVQEVSEAEDHVGCSKNCLHLEHRPPEVQTPIIQFEGEAAGLVSLVVQVGEQGDANLLEVEVFVRHAHVDLQPLPPEWN